MSEQPHVKAAREHLGLTRSGLSTLSRACISGRLFGGVAADKLVADGFAQRLPRVWGRSIATPTPKGREAVRVMFAAGWRPQPSKRSTAFLRRSH